jgi:hypothetical protein
MKPAYEQSSGSLVIATCFCKLVVEYDLVGAYNPGVTPEQKTRGHAETGQTSGR